MKTAEPKPRKELRDFLNDEQKRQVAKYGYFDVVGNEGNHYRIYTTGCSGNVFRVGPNGEPYTSYCAHLDTYQHLDGRGDTSWKKFYEDNALVQMLTIQYSERNFRDVAHY